MKAIDQPVSPSRGIGGLTPVVALARGNILTEAARQCGRQLVFHAGDALCGETVSRLQGKCG
jgi:hypothetical protein